MCAAEESVWERERWGGGGGGGGRGVCAYHLISISSSFHCNHVSITSKLLIFELESRYFGGNT